MLVIKYKVSRDEVVIKIVEIMIKIGIHAFLTYSKILYDHIHKYRIQAFVIQSLWNHGSSVSIQF